MACSEVFGPDEVAIGHFDDRTPLRWFLMGEGPISGENFVLRSRPEVVATWDVIERSGETIFARRAGELLAADD